MFYDAFESFITLSRSHYYQSLLHQEDDQSVGVKSNFGDFQIIEIPILGKNRNDSVQCH